MGLVGLIGGWMYLSQASSPPPPPASTLMGCQFEAGDGLLFTLSQEGSTRQNQRALGKQAGFKSTGTTVDNEVTLKGKMLWELNHTTEDTFQFHAQMQGFSIEHSGNGESPELETQKAMMHIPFGFNLDKRCRFTSFGFAKEVKTEVRDMLKGLLQNLEFVTAPTSQDQAWQVKQHHALGQYLGFYTTSGPELELQRRKELTPSAREKNALRKLSLTPKLNHTMMTVTRDAQGKWATQIDGSEDLELLMGNTTMAEMRYDFTLTRERYFKHNHSITLAKSLDWLDATQLQQASEKSDDWKAAVSRIPSLPYATLLSRAQDLIKAKDFNAVWQFLALYYRAHPEIIATLLNDIRGGQLEDILESWVIMALGKADISQADSALRELLEDDAYPHRARYRGIVAHLNMKDIDSQNLDALLTLSNDWTKSGEGKAQVRSSSARHMIGNQLAVMNKSGDSRKEDIATVLKDWLDSAQPGFEQRVSIKSIGNSGDAQFFEQMREVSEGADERTREVTYHAMRFIDNEESHAFFLDRIQSEASPEAFQELSETVAGQSFAQQRDELIKVVGERLLMEPNADIRVYLINILASIIEQGPAAKAYLSQQLKQEKVMKVVQRIGEVMAQANNAN